MFGHRLRTSTLLAGLLFCCTETSWAITATPSWKPRETVTSTLADFSSHTSADTILAYDHHGNPGVAFYDNTFGSLRYARRVPGVGWAHVEVDTTSFVGEDPSLAYDRYERPAISYGNGPLKFAHFDGAAWQLETVDITAVQDSSLAFDLFGRPAIAYQASIPDDLMYILDTDGDFSFLDETPVVVSSVLSEGFSASLAFDHQNRPMIVHRELTNSDLRFSVEEPGIGWVTTTIDDTPGDTASHPSIDIDPDTGFPAIAYNDGSVNSLRYAAWNGDSWDFETITTGGVPGAAGLSLKFDPADGNPAIAYRGGGLSLAWHDGISWQTQLVDAVASGLYPSLAFNDFGTGFPSVAYFDNATSLYFIEDPPAAVPEPAAALLLAAGVFGLICHRHRAHA